MQIIIIVIKIMIIELRVRSSILPKPHQADQALTVSLTSPDQASNMIMIMIMMLVVMMMID